MSDDETARKLQRDIDKAVKLSNIDLARNLYNELGSLYYGEEKYDLALNAYLNGLKLSVQLNEKLLIAEGHNWVADCFYLTGQFKKARRHALQSLSFYTSARLHSKKLTCTSMIARIYLCWGQLFKDVSAWKRCTKCEYFMETAKKYFNKCLTMCDDPFVEIPTKEKLNAKAEVLRNMGNVMLYKKDIKGALSFVNLAIAINTTQGFKENLYRCYYDLGEMFFKIKKYNDALAHFNSSLKYALNKENRKQALIEITKVYLAQRNYEKPKLILREILQMGFNKSQALINKLKIVIKLNKIVNVLNSLPEDNYASRYKLYESEGDINCSIKNYVQAVSSYLKMLECGRALGHSNEELLPCYTSLTETYKDLGEYDNAIKYGEMEYEIVKDKPVDAIKVLLDLSVIHIWAYHPLQTIRDCYSKAKVVAEKLGDKSESCKILKSMKSFLKDIADSDKRLTLQKDIENWKKDLDICDEQLELTDEDESVDESDGPLVLEYEVDVSDSELFSDNENTRYRYRSKRNAYKVRRNPKGETELHVCVIKGDYNKAKDLIRAGHPIDEEDANGWTVLHEACNLGFKEIAELLLNEGADVNCSGGRGTCGITPLHDACENGHYSVIQLLLDRGASTCVVSKAGLTPLDCLNSYRDRHGISSTDPDYKKYAEKLRSLLDCPKERSNRRKFISGLPKFGVQSYNEISRSDKFKVSNNPVNVMKPVVSTSSGPIHQKNSAVNLYKEAIAGVRKRPQKILQPVLPEKKGKISASPFVDEDEVISDKLWVRRDSDEEVLLSSSESRDNPRANLDSDDSSSDGCNSQIHFPYRCGINDTGASTSRACFSPQSSMSLPKSPKNFEAPNTVDENNSILVESIHSKDSSGSMEKKSKAMEGSSISLEQENSTETSVASGFKKKIIRLKVKILDESILIILDESVLYNNTVEWLWREACQRYCEITGRKPKIRLTIDGAKLSTTDPLITVIDQEIVGVYDGPKNSVTEIYCEDCMRKDNCFNMTNNESITPSLEAMSSLEMATIDNKFILRNMSLPLRHFRAIFKALKEHKMNLSELDIAGNNLTDDGVPFLIEYLTCCHVKTLNLANNKITVRGLYYFIRALSEFHKVNHESIKHLNFSGNQIVEDCEYIFKEMSTVLTGLECILVGDQIFPPSKDNLKQEPVGEIIEVSRFIHCTTD